MKTKYRYTSLILLILALSGLFGIATAADAQEVYALLIILGNDRVIAESVAKNEQKMVNMLRQLSYHCNVHLTLMYSESSHEGTVSEKTFINGRSEKPTTQTQDIIEAKQVVEWLETLTPKPEDTVLVYYTGHGKMDPLGAHNLLFNPGVSPEDNLDRGKFSDRLKQKSARLRMFITDTCSKYVSEDLSDDTFAKYAVEVRAKARAYLQDLFLEHKGFLDITAASSGEFAIANDELGGHFTSALISHGFTATADTNNDTFLSWEEAFEKTKTQTRELYAEATFGPQMQRNLEVSGQDTQEPYQHSLPSRIGEGGGSVPSQGPGTTASTAILNFTSVPSGATVSIDNAIVGKTPLTNYEIEMDGGSTKEIKVTIKASGYEDSVETFRVRRGKPFEWEFELTKKAPEIPTQPPVITPATIAQNGADFDETLLQGHTDDVNSVLFSPDGQTIASGSDDKTIRLWEVSTGKLIRTLTGHMDDVNSVSFSPDGQTIVSGSSDKTVRLWDASTGKLIRTLTGHMDDVNSVLFSPDGQTIASGSSDKTVRLWDASTGKLIHTLNGHTDWVGSVSFSPDGRTIASGGGDKTVRLWDASTGKLIHTLNGHTDWVGSVSFSPDGRTIASGGGDKTVRLWEVSTGKRIHTLTGHTDEVYSVSFSPDGRTIASGSDDKTVRLWDASTGKRIRTLNGHTSWVESVSFSPDGRRIVSGGAGHTGHLWELAD